MMKMNPLGALLQINWSGRGMRLLDLAFAIGLLVYGVVSGSQLLLWAGVASVALSLLNPMGRLQRGLARFRKPAGRG
jgi:hypothetical protein